mmetsp:Transcript_2042/g.4414  ORF Transcript_2042/g.4414 Transcript_2042/m.4414 type:complete len:217 (+) Transcript_2042:475-1125(+)
MCLESFRGTAGGDVRRTSPARARLWQLSGCGANGQGLRGAAEVRALLLPFPQWRGRDGRLRPRQRFLVHPAPVHGHVACGEPGVSDSRFVDAHLLYGLFPLDGGGVRGSLESLQLRGVGFREGHGPRRLPWLSPGRSLAALAAGGALQRDPLRRREEHAVVEPHEMPPRPPGVDPWGSQHSGRSYVYPPAAAGPTSGTRGEAAPETPPGDLRLVSW